MVKADKYDTLKADYKGLETKYQTDVADANGKLDEAMKKATDYDTLKGTLDELKTENAKIIDEHKSTTERIKKQSAVDVALLKSNVKDGYADILKGQIDLDKLQFDGENLIGLNDTIESFKTKYVDLFGETKKSGTLPPAEGKVPDTGKRAKLIEAYNNAEKKKDAKQMMALTAEIKKLKE